MGNLPSLGLEADEILRVGCQHQSHDPPELRQAVLQEMAPAPLLPIHQGVSELVAQIPVK